MLLATVVVMLWFVRACSSKDPGFSFSPYCPWNTTIKDRYSRDVYRVFTTVMKNTNCQVYVDKDMDTRAFPVNLSISSISLGRDEQKITVEWHLHPGKLKRFFLLSLKLGFKENDFKITDDNRQCILFKARKLKPESYERVNLKFDCIRANVPTVATLTAEVSTDPKRDCDVEASKTCFPRPPFRRSEDVRHVAVTSTSTSAPYQYTANDTAVSVHVAAVTAAEKPKNIGLIAVVVVLSVLTVLVTAFVFYRIKVRDTRRSSRPSAENNTSSNGHATSTRTSPTEISTGVESEGLLQDNASVELSKEQRPDEPS